MSDRQQVLNEPPLDRLREVAEHHQEAKVIVKKQTIRGTWATVPGFNLPISDLIGDGLEQYLRQNLGGARYRIDVRNINNVVEQLCPPYMVEVAGPDISVHAGRSTILGGPSATQHHAHQFPVGPPPTWPQMSTHYAGMDQPAPQDPRMFFERPPDAIASEYVQQLRLEMKEMRDQSAGDRVSFERKLEHAREQHLRLQNELQEKQRQHEKELFEAKLDGLKSSFTASPKGPNLLEIMTALTGVVGALAPVFQAMVSSGATKSDALAKAQADNFKHLTEIVKVSGDRKPFDVAEMIKVSGPIVGLFRTFLEERSPAKAAELVATMAENNMGMLTLAAQAISQLAGESESPGVQMVREALSGLVGMAERMAERKELAAPPATALRTMSRPKTAAPAATPQMTPEALAERIINDPNWPPAFRSESWHELLAGMHDIRVDAKDVGEGLAELLQESYDAKTLPPAFRPVFDTDEPASKFIRPLLQQLPLSQSVPRLDAVCSALDKAFEPETNGAAGPPHVVEVQPEETEEVEAQT